MVITKVSQKVYLWPLLLSGSQDTHTHTPAPPPIFSPCFPRSQHKQTSVSQLSPPNLVVLFKCCNVIHRHFLKQQSPMVRPITILHDQAAKEVCLHKQQNQTTKKPPYVAISLPLNFWGQITYTQTVHKYPPVFSPGSAKEDSCLRPSYSTQ